MPIYHADEMSFEIPDGFVDRSMTVLAPRGEPALSLVITREPRSEEPLAAQVSQIAATLTEKLPGVRVLGQREREAGGVRARELRATATVDGVATYARQVFIDYYGTLLTFSITSKRAHQPLCDRATETLMGSLKLRKR